MHPAMAVWIWSVAMLRAWQSSMWEGGNLGLSLDTAPATTQPRTRLANYDIRLVPANDYLHFEVAEKPLPDVLLDRLADLYWAERDAELAI